MTDIENVSKLVTPIAQKYGADRVALFGSRAKNTATETSDYDFVISKGKIQSLFQLAAFIDELEMAFGKNVDVITDTSNDIGFLERIKKDEVVVYAAKR
ncbi:MAG: nucleotidyltransferase domain-containing protein [Clostridium sp.]|nr:nucleotidyltransferase domain-containing protein [Acetatifactor muris]MCM1527707.1 nucleotidyltransferase domain-containing protein [Bacteroides sp.]MCM1563964.1 nucleotidyltransferase domain-containing protein [Clostridium sp.]